MQKRNPVPLKNVLFVANVNQGYAELVVHQLYENNADNPLEIDFVMPVSQEFTISKLVIDFTLADGTKETIITMVQEKEKAEQKY